MGVGEICDVDIVPDGGAIGRRIVGAEYSEITDMPLDGHHRSRDQMRLRIAQLADFPFGIRATGIEISERHDAQTIGAREIAEDTLDHALRGAVGVHGLLRRVFANGITAGSP